MSLHIFQKYRSEFDKTRHFKRKIDFFLGGGRDSLAASSSGPHPSPRTKPGFARSFPCRFTARSTPMARLRSWLWLLASGIGCVSKEMATAKELDELAECPVCRQVFTDPRVLPCGHTFCLQCIDAWRNAKRTTMKKMPCPLCRKMFLLPKSGVGGLPTNFFVVDFFLMKGLQFFCIFRSLSVK